MTNRAGEPDVRHTLDVNMTVVPHVLLDADGQDEDTPNTPGMYRDSPKYFDKFEQPQGTLLTGFCRGIFERSTN